MFYDISPIEVYAFHESVSKFLVQDILLFRVAVYLLNSFFKAKLVWPDTFTFSEVSTTLHNGSWPMVKGTETRLSTSQFAPEWNVPRNGANSKSRAVRGAGADVAFLRPAELSIQAFIFQVSETLCNFWKDTERCSLVTAPFKPKLLSHFGKDF